MGHRNDVGFFSFRLSGWSGKLLITSVHDRKKACQRHFTACRMLSEDTIWHLHKRQLGSLCSCHNSPDWTLNYIDRARRSKKKAYSRLADTEPKAVTCVCSTQEIPGHCLTVLFEMWRSAKMNIHNFGYFRTNASSLCRSAVPARKSVTQIEVKHARQVTRPYVCTYGAEVISHKNDTHLFNNNNNK